VSVADGLEGVQDDRKYLVTFDDGYRNNLTEALPVLEWHDVPCLFFLTTGFINGSVYPYELELAAAVEKMDPLSIPGRSEKIPSQTLSDRRLYRELRRPLKPKQHDAREAFMDQLADRNDYDRAEVQKEPVLNWDEVRELSDHPLVTIGVHTHSHVVLAHQPWRVAYRELKSSKHCLEGQIGKPVEYLSYPYGSNSLIVRQMARWLGVRYGFTTQPKRVHRLNIWNRLAIPRIDIAEFVNGDR
jgi:peptidoglycan/xylan/chitin deacetylase (PgdA/CDA1 family)